MILNYLGGPNVISGVLKVDEREEKIREIICDLRRLQCAIFGYEGSDFRQPPEAGNCEEIECPLEVPKGMQLY